MLEPQFVTLYRPGINSLSDLRIFPSLAIRLAPSQRKLGLVWVRIRPAVAMQVSSGPLFFFGVNAPHVCQLPDTQWLTTIYRLTIFGLDRLKFNGSTRLLVGHQHKVGCPSKPPPLLRSPLGVRTIALAWRSIAHRAEH